MLLGFFALCFFPSFSSFPSQSAGNKNNHIILISFVQIVESFIRKEGEKKAKRIENWSFISNKLKYKLVNLSTEAKV